MQQVHPIKKEHPDITVKILQLITEFIIQQKVKGN